MASYPKFTVRKPVDASELHDDMFRWANELTRELDSNDLKQRSAPSTNIYAVVTITEIGRPNQGDIAYVISTGKFKGYRVTTTDYTGGWVDFN